MRPATMATTIDPIRVLRRHMVGIIASAIIGAVLGTGAFLALRSFYPLYSGQVLFEIRPALQKASDVGSTDISNDEMVFRIGQTETFLLTSRDVLDAALRNPDVRGTAWGRQYTTADNKFNNEDALDDLKKEVGTTVVRSSNLFSAKWSSTVPADVPIVLNAIAKAYIDNRAARDNVVYDKNLSVFNDQLDTTNRDLNELTTEINKLIADAKFTTLEDSYKSAQAFKMQQLTEQLTDAETRLSISSTQLQTIQDQLKGTVEFSALETLEAERDPAVVAQIEQIQAGNAELRRLYKTMAPDNQQLVSLENRVKSMMAERDQKVAEIRRRNLEAKAREASVDVEKYKNASAQIEAQVEKNNILLQDVAAKQSQYELLRTKREHLVAQRQADQQLINEVRLMRFRDDSSRVRQVQAAITPREPSFPKPEIMIPLGSLLLLGLTVGIVFLRELMDQRVKSASDVAVIPGANVLGVIPDRDDDPTKTTSAELIVRRHPTSVLTESYRQATTAMMPMLDRNGHQTLLLVGGMPGSGTTTVASNLAASAAASGRRVIVVDANFRRPRLAEAMGVSGAGSGLADVLSGSATIADSIVDAEGIAVMPAGTAANRVFDRVNGGAFDGVLAQLREQFDLIIFDAPPAVVSGDAMVLANKVDASILVVRANQEQRGLVARMIRQLGDTRSELLGVLLNRPRGIAGGYLKKNYATMAEYSAKA